MRIFVSIASYDDPELQKTIDDLYAKAARPQNLIVGVVNQFKNSHTLVAPTDSKIRMFCMPASEAMGAGYARAMAQKLYQGEEYYLQIDSHMRFIQNWDRILLRNYGLAVGKEGTKKVIITQLPDDYSYGPDGDELYSIYDKAPDTPSYTMADFYPFRGGWGGKARAFTQSTHKFPKPWGPEASQVILAGFTFAPGGIVSEVPYDPDISFMGEEMCFSMRAYTRGWKIYSPNEVLSYHMYDMYRTKHGLTRYATHNEKRAELEEVSREKQALILTGTITGKYGAHTADRVKVYEDYIRQYIGSPYKTILKKQLKMGVRKAWKEDRTLYTVPDLTPKETIDNIEYYTEA